MGRYGDAERKTTPWVISEGLHDLHGYMCVCVRPPLCFLWESIPVSGALLTWGEEGAWVSVHHQWWLASRGEGGELSSTQRANTAFLSFGMKWHMWGLNKACCFCTTKKYFCDCPNKNATGVSQSSEKQVWVGLGYITKVFSFQTKDMKTFSAFSFYKKKKRMWWFAGSYSKLNIFEFLDRLSDKTKQFEDVATGVLFLDLMVLGSPVPGCVCDRGAAFFPRLRNLHLSNNNQRTRT